FRDAVRLGDIGDMAELGPLHRAIDESTERVARLAGESHYPASPTGGKSRRSEWRPPVAGPDGSSRQCPEFIIILSFVNSRPSLSTLAPAGICRWCDTVASGSGGRGGRARARHAHDEDQT